MLGGVGEDERGDVGQHDGGARHNEESSSPSANKYVVAIAIIEYLTPYALNITLTSSSQRQSDLQTSAWTGSCWRASSDEAGSSSAATWCCLITLKLSPKWSTNLSIGNVANNNAFN